MFESKKMGLDMLCDGISIRVGSYTSFYKMKIMFIYNCIYYIRDKIEKTTDECDIYMFEDLMGHLLKLLNLDNYENYDLDNNINFKYYDKNKEHFKNLIMYDLDGLLPWILCSDTKGMLNTIDSEKIYDFLKLTLKSSIPYYRKNSDKMTLLNYFYNIDENDDEININNFYLSPILLTSIRTGEDIYLA